MHISDQPITTDSPIYRSVFEQYLRKGTAIEVSIKALQAAETKAENAENHTTNLYIWRTAGDEKVRPSHAANDGKFFYWGNRSATGHPGEDYNCRCWAEPIRPDNTPLEILALIASLSPIRLARRIGLGIARSALRRALEDKPPPAKPAEPPVPKLNDTKTWPTPPKQGRFKEGDPSRSKPRMRGEKSLYDENGGEWRYSPEDKYHNPHWDYKPAGVKEQWQNVRIGNKPPLK